jgi:ADP-heptose:LPS heptosyltransferase
LLGDIIFTIPAIQLYKNHYPEHRLYYVVEEDFTDIADLIPGIHEVLVIPRQMGLKDFMDFRKKVRGIGFNRVIDFHSGPKSALLTYLSGIKTRIGYRTPNRNYAYTKLTPRNTSDSATHSTLNQALLLEHMNIKIKANAENIPPYPSIVIPDGSVSGRLRKPLPGGKKAVIHVGAGNRFRDWGLDNFSSLIEKLQRDSLSIFLIGNTNTEKERGKILETRFAVTDFTGQLSIKETLSLIDGADIYIGFDSGPLHLASLTRTPLVAMYGPNIPEISGPWRKEYLTIVQLKMKCRPCSQRKCIYDTIRCIHDIEVDRVYEAVKKYTG